MCSTRILSRSEDGFVNQCSECGNINLAFGTSLLRLSKLDFFRLSSQVHDNIRDTSFENQQTVKCIQIFHPSASEFSLVLNAIELEKLRKMMLDAHILIEAYNILYDE